MHVKWAIWYSQLMLRTHAPVSHHIWVRLSELLSRLPNAKVSVTHDPCFGDWRPDLAVEVTQGSRAHKLLVEVKSLASSRALAELAQRTVPADATEGPTQLVLAAPIIGPRLAEECRRLGLGYVDMAGNAHVAVGPIYMDVTGARGDTEPQEMPLDSVFAPKSSRVLRPLLAERERPFLQIELAELTGASNALVSRVIRLLRDEGLAERVSGGVMLNDPTAVLDLWADAYRRRRIAWRAWHVAGLDPRELPRDITSALARADVRAAFTGPLPAARRAPYLTADLVHLYADAGCEVSLHEMGARPATGGGGLMVNSPPWDQGVFLFATKEGGIALAHPVQVYLDLIRMGGRAEEAAGVYRDRVLGY